MVAIILPGSMTTNKGLLAALEKKLLNVTFCADNKFYWSPQTKTIFFNRVLVDTHEGTWALLHEAGHAWLKHQTYDNDFGLLKLEVAAWQAAQELANQRGITIDSGHIQDCLDTYRDWLYTRSTCPTCMLNSLQINKTTYQCSNCSTKWSVSSARFCRPYRMLKHANLKSEVLSPKQSQKTKSKTAQNVFV